MYLSDADMRTVAVPAVLVSLSVQGCRLYSMPGWSIRADTRTCNNIWCEQS